MSSRRGIAPMAELVCSVVYTWWPVMAARNAISAVSWSRISPTRMMSGSWRIMERMPLTKSILAASFTEVWRIIAIGYSTGSSRVMMFTDSVLSCFSTEYSVVVLPLPVGPVTSRMPSGRASIRLSVFRCAWCRPSWSRRTMRLFPVQDAQHDVLAVDGRLRRHAEIDRPAGQVERDAPVLRCAGLGDVHAAHDLQAHRHRRPVVLVQAAHLPQHAVDAIADAQERALGLEVDVGRAPLYRVGEQRVDQAHDRLADTRRRRACRLW